jgi:hypothetical protein
VRPCSVLMCSACSSPAPFCSHSCPLLTGDFTGTKAHVPLTDLVQFHLSLRATAPLSPPAKQVITRLLTLHYTRRHPALFPRCSLAPSVSIISCNSIWGPTHHRSIGSTLSPDRQSNCPPCMPTQSVPNSQAGNTLAAVAARSAHCAAMVCI